MMALVPMSYMACTVDQVAWMKLACAQARLSVPVETGYCVGCVLVKDGKVIASGFSRELPGGCLLISLGSVGGM